MDFQALQHKLFALDPSDPKEDLAKLRGMNMGGAPQMPADPQIPVSYTHLTLPTNREV